MKSVWKWLKTIFGWVVVVIQNKPAEDRKHHVEIRKEQQKKQKEAKKEIEAILDQPVGAKDKIKKINELLGWE